MRISVNANRCESSPMRMFHPLAVAAKEAGKKIYHLNCPVAYKLLVKVLFWDAII